MTSAIDVPSALPSAEAGSSATVAESPASEDAVQSDSSQQQQEQQQELQQQYDDEPYKQQQQGQQQQVREELGSTDTTSMTVGVVFGTSLPAIEATPKGRRGRKPKSMQRLAHNGNSESSPVTSNSNNGANTPRYMTRRTNSNTSVATEHEAAQTLESNEIMSSLMNNDLFAGNDGAGMINTEKSGASTPAWNMASVFDTTAGLKSPQRRGRPPKHSSRSNRRGASEAPSSIVALPELSSGGSEISAEHIKPREERPYTDFINSTAAFTVSAHRDYYYCWTKFEECAIERASAHKD
ncbi:hypothetical protein GQ42DRAFT_153325 [Ramicandelaber brevisporus]|nr:hypothetical protein GQ42DRAFT_153325 [Ramicandelaber brevisporus]